MTTDAAMARIDPVSSTMSPARTVLMIAYAFPPEAYVGGRRTLKYCKYLGQFGWRSIVVTIKPRPDAFQDESLSRQLPPDVVVLRTRDTDAADWLARMSAWRSRRRGPAATSTAPLDNRDATNTSPRRMWFARFKQFVSRCLLECPDSHVFWVPAAFFRGARVLLTRRVDVIYSSSPPHSSHVAAFLLARCFGKPHVVDFRDPWIVNGSTRPPGFSQGPLMRVQTRVKRAILANAANVVVVTPGEPDELRAEFPRLAERRIAVITNGYDEEDFSTAATDEPDPAHVTITHTGTIYGETGQEFFEAIEQLVEANGHLKDALRINLIGVDDGGDRAPVRRLAAAGILRSRGSQPHAAALAWARRSDVLLLLSRSGTHGSSHIPAKVFEYLAIGRPILAIAEPGALTEILDRSGLGVTVRPGDVQEIQRTILSLYARWRAGTLRGRADGSYIKRFDRRVLTERFAAVLEEAVSR